MTKLTKILEYAQSMGETANHAEKIGSNAQGEVYSLSLWNDEGVPMPIGLPRLVISKGDKYSLLTGEAALKLVGSFGLNE